MENSPPQRSDFVVLGEEPCTTYSSPPRTERQDEELPPKNDSDFVVLGEESLHPLFISSATKATNAGRVPKRRAVRCQKA
ncbi:hypothetical protein E4U39_004430 [Claviceps sp. Clav50 group G5]|nr:hypothetical protein E4U39_004430 [Claviceps sp. Clav50 group G5]